MRFQLRLHRFQCAVAWVALAVMAMAFTPGLWAQSSPAQPVLFWPVNGATDVPTTPTLDVVASDPDGGNLTVTFYGRPSSGSTEGDFTLIVLPDTQYYSSSLNGGSPAIFNAQTQWIVDNLTAKNIAYVAHVGDIVQDGDKSESPWVYADEAMQRLEDPGRTGLADGLPFGMAVGNHDQTPTGSPSGTTTYYNKYFGSSRFAGRSYYGGQLSPNSDNHYDLFSAGGNDFIVIYVEFGSENSSTVLNWANQLLAKYSQRLGIIVSHYLISSGDPGSFQSRAQVLYDTLKVNPNLFLMLCGHLSEGKRQDTYNGNTVTTLMSDYQSRSNGGDGWLRIMEFSPSKKTVQVRTYSPTLNKFETDSSSQFSFSWNPKPSQYSAIGSTTVSSGSHASLVWNGLAPGTAYQWYVVVSDGTRSTTGPTWTFTTGNSAPIAESQSVSTAENSAVAITLSGHDPEGSPLSYSVVSQPAHGSLSGTTPRLTYTPAANYSGSDSFTFTVSDGQMTSAPATVSITVNAADPLPPPPPGSGLTFIPVADAHVRSSSASSNYGSLSYLRTRETSSEKYRGYLRFNVSGLGGTPSAAKLRLFVTDDTPDPTNVYRTGESWTESGITWDNAPALSTLVGSVAQAPLNTWVEITLPANLFTANGNYSFVLVASGSNSAFFASRESSTPPQLVLTSDSTGTTAPVISSFTPGSGTAGTEVTIQGSGLAGTTAVSFNGTAAASLQVDSDTQVRAVVPNGATSGKITVSTPAGVGTSSSDFTITVPSPSITSFSPTSGEVGTSVTISGSNFSGATAVKFSGTTASFTVSSSSQIKATVPGGASSGKISVTTLGGTASSSSSFTVTAPPGPTISSFTPSSGAAGTLVTIAGTAFSGATQVTLSGMAANFTVQSDTQIQATVPSGATSGKFAVTTPYGSATSAADFLVTQSSGSTATLTFPAAADAYIKSSSPSNNYGSITWLRVRQSSSEVYRSYLRFHLSGLAGTVTSAKLRMYVTDETPDTIAVYSGSNAWQESLITWANAPPVASLLAFRSGASLNTWMEISLPVSAFPSDGDYTLVLASDNSNSALWSSRETSSPPQLVLTTGP